jgi:hypothetical protein
LFQLGLGLTVVDPGEPLSMAATTDWGAYPVDEAALRRGTGVEKEMSDSSHASTPHEHACAGSRARRSGAHQAILI